MVMLLVLLQVVGWLVAVVLHPYRLWRLHPGYDVGVKVKMKRGWLVAG